MSDYPWVFPTYCAVLLSNRGDTKGVYRCCKISDVPVGCEVGVTYVVQAVGECGGDMTDTPQKMALKRTTKTGGCMRQL